MSTHPIALAPPDPRPLAERWPEWAARQDGAIVSLAVEVTSEMSRRILRRRRGALALALAVRADELGLDSSRWLAVWESLGAPEPPADEPRWLALRADLDRWESMCLGTATGTAA